MADRHPKALSDVLTYLDGLGFEHLYVSRPSTAVSQAPMRRAARPQEDRVSPPGRPQQAQPQQAQPQRARPPASEARSAAPTPTKEDKSSAVVHAAAGPAALPISGDQRARQFAELQAEAETCRRCALCETRKTVVFGSGRPDARLMFIGEGPGSEEDRQGLPFVGPAGALLTRIIEAIGLRRDQVYIANVVKCRPPRNRDPVPAEVQACRDFLERQIDLVQPEVLVALGRVASQALLNTSASLGSLRGRWHRVKGIETRVTYHPAALLRYEKWKRPTWEDMKVVRDRLSSGH